MSTTTELQIQPLEPFEHIELKDGNRIWLSQEPDSDSEVAPSEPLYLVSAVSPAHSEFYVPPHFHPYSDEYMRCICGQLHVTLDGVSVVVRPEDGELKISKGVVHSIKSPRGEHAEFQERSDPDPVKKRDLLRRLFVLLDEPSPPMLKILTLFYEDQDSFPGEGPKFMGKAIVYIVGGFFGSFLGLGKQMAKKT